MMLNTVNTRGLLANGRVSMEMNSMKTETRARLRSKERDCGDGSAEAGDRERWIPIGEGEREG